MTGNFHEQKKTGKENGKAETAGKDAQRSENAASRVVVSFHGPAARAWRDLRAQYPTLSDSEILRAQARANPFESAMQAYDTFQGLAAAPGALQGANELLALFGALLRQIHYQKRDPKPIAARVREILARGGLDGGSA